MKKVLSIVLSICLPITSMSAVLTQSVAAGTLDSAFETQSNWGYYKNAGTVIDGTATANSSGWPSISETTAFTATGSGKAIKIWTNITHAVVKIPDLKAYTNYTINFKHMIPANSSTGSQWFNSYIFKKGYALDAAAPTNAYASGVSPTANADDSWNNYSISFVTDNTAEFFLSIYPRFSAGNTVYLDEFELIKGETFTPVTISFESNGGSKVEPLLGSSGKPIVMPTNPTKEGYAFAGWYTDKAFTNQFLGKVAPETDVTLYARWIDGIYMDFESSTTGTVVTGTDTSYNGNKAYKVSFAAASGTSQIVLEHNADRKLSDWANFGDSILISFKYKLVSGSVNFYPRTSTKTPGASLPKYYYEDAKTSAVKSNWANGLAYKNIDLKTASNEWQTFTSAFTVNDESYLDGKFKDEALTQPLTKEDILGYVMLFVSSKAENTELYIDDVTVIKTVNIPVEYTTEAVRLEPLNGNNTFANAIFASELSFKAVCDSSVTPTVYYGEKVVTPVDGIYTITVADETLRVEATGMTAAQNHAPGVGLNGEDLTKYDADLFLENIWEGDTIYHESVMFTDSLDGTVLKTKKLLYPIDDIISVRNDDLNKWYVKGVDFEVKDGKLCWIEGGKCPIWTGHLIVPANADDPYYDEALDYGGFNSASAYYTLEPNGDKGLYLMADDKHEDATIYVTYKHSKTWDEVGETGYTPAAPENQSDDMKPFYDKLATTEDVNVLVYGASTATGCGATGGFLTYELFSKTPDAETGDYTVTERKENGSGKSAPTFFEQATAKLVNDYGNNNKINYYNIACGGTGAKWGAEQLQNRVAAMNKYYGKTIVPDIIYIKFAGNDVRTTPESYRASLTSMTEQFQALYPNAVVVLVSGKINNEKCYIFGDYHQNVLDLEQVVLDIAASKTNCVAAATTSVWAEIVESKDYEDYLSNNINHANDFWSKTTAQIIVASLAKTENHEHIYDNYLDPDCNSCGDVREITFTGWHPAGNTWYYYENGNMVKNEWRQDSVGWVFLGETGAMLTNAWCTDSAGWCYVGANGYAVTDCWMKDSIGWCYLGVNGSQVKNNWVYDGGCWYFIDADGYMVSNQWRQDSKGWVYLGSSGAMLTNAWCTDSQGWCYVGADGYAVTNCWKQDSIGWIWLNANGSMTKSAWVLDGSNWYYLNAEGYMVTGWQLIDGVWYNFNAGGVWVG